MVPALPPNSQRQEELYIADKILRTSEFCYTVEEMMTLRFLLLAERCRLFH